MIPTSGPCAANGDSAWAVARYTPDGLPDTAGFNSPGVVSGTRVLNLVVGCNDFAQSVIVQPDHKIVIVGWGQNFISTTFDLVRLNEDGSMDTTFGTTGRVSFVTGSPVGLPYAVRRIGGASADAGKYIVVGENARSEFSPCRMLSPSST